MDFSKIQLLTQIDAKLQHMANNPGVNFTPEELTMLRNLLKSVKDEVGRVDEVVAPVGVEKDRVEILEERSRNQGYCYLVLMSTLPSFETVSHDVFNRTLKCLESCLGPIPEGRETILNLTMCEAVLCGDFEPEVIGSDNPEILMKPDQHLKNLAKMTESKFRFNYEDAGGIMHITWNREKCTCSEILCDHGWASRFILQIITRPGQKVGAGTEIDFSKFFIMEEDVKEAKKKKEEERKAASEARKDKNGEMKRSMEKDMVNMLEGQLNARTEALELALLTLMSDREQKKGTDCESVTEDERSDLESTIHPIDSSSVVERYGRKFMPSGSVYKVGKASTVLEPVQEIQDLQPTVNVVQGFMRTQGMREAERQSNSQVHAINGLAAPFKDVRLNFLCHFHTALQECNIDPQSNPTDALDSIGTLKPQNPTDELIKQVVIRTFDFDETVVIANPFRLPFIEVGMLITDSMLIKCLTLLESEYKTKWFEQMKCLKIPKFHDEFGSLSTRVRQSHGSRRTSEGHIRQRRYSGRQSTDSEGDQTLHVRKAQGSSSKRPQSFLGLRTYR